MKLNYAFIDKLTALPFITNIYLFGSRARGDNAPRADIDLAIVCPEATDSDWQKIIDIIENADTLLKIDCLRFDKISNAELKEKIEHDKIVIFQRSK